MMCRSDVRARIACLSLAAFVAQTIGFSTVSAQGPEDQDILLHHEFRAALLADPRSATMSEGELDLLVNTLIEEAHTQNLASDFVPLPSPPPAPMAVSGYEMGVITTPWGYPVSLGFLYSIILLSLAIAGGMLWLLLHLHKKHTSLDQ
jgi:hypothetical protein